MASTKVSDKKPISISTHSSKEISRGLVRKIIRDLEISREELLWLLRE